LLRETFGRTQAQETAQKWFPEAPKDSVSLLLDALDKKINVVPTSSAGRLFDAVAAITGVCTKTSFEGQAPMLLEAIASRKFSGLYPFTIVHENGLLEIDWKELVANLSSDAKAGKPPETISRRFHDTLAAAILEAVSRLAERIGTRNVIISGGVFQNATLLGMVLSGLRRKRFISLTHRQVPVNDGGISLGQAYYAALRVAGR
jgi:hydrogenase maturation protein HypF